MNRKIGFIGCGNMGKAMLGALVKADNISNDNIIVSTKSKASAEKINDEYGVKSTTVNSEVAKEADVLFLAVKPYFFKEVIEEIKDLVKDEAIIISIAAGVTVNQIEEWFGKEIKLVRTMPNTPASVGEGMSAISPNGNITENELNYIDSIIFEIELASSTKEIQEILDEISENLIKNKVSQKKKNTKNSKKKKQEKQYSPLHFNIDNFDVYVGKNNKENDWLTFTFASKNDIWLHTKDIQGSHVIIKTLGLNISDDTLVKCAKLAVEHSKAKLSSNVPVDYCKVQYVKKPNSAKPGMVIFTNNKTISVTSCQ
mgnify:CR=1 FL=1